MSRIEAAPAESERDEKPREGEARRLDRELIELLNELRVALPGALVLFAFLLTMPFTSRFAQLSRVNRDAYFIAFLASATASVLLIAPSAFHRLRWRRGEKERMLQVSNHLALAGIASLAIGITAVVYLITALLYGSVAAAAVAAVTAGAIGWLWYALPLSTRRR